MTDYCLSDVHLRPDDPALTAALLSFIARCHSGERCFILGDLFDLWAGDDIGCADFPAVLAGLRAATRAGVAIGFMPGNHDFLIRSRFLLDSGCVLLPDPFVTVLAGRRAVLTHGDQLCTLDVAYQRFRAQVRNPEWQQQVLAKPIAQRRALADELQQGSTQAKQDKSLDEMDAQPDACTALLREHRATLLVHGHTHRPGVHELPQAEPAMRAVLGYWRQQPLVLAAGNAAWQLEQPDGTPAAI